MIEGWLTVHLPYDSSPNVYEYADANHQIAEKHTSAHTQLQLVYAYREERPANQSAATSIMSYR